MPANTGHGYPYPVGTDRVMDGDDSIKNLAEKVDQQLGVSACGVATVPITAGGVVATIAVSFPAGRFTAAPAVVTTINTGVPDTFHANAISITTTGFTIQGIRATGNSPFPVSWIAMQQ